MIFMVSEVIRDMELGSMSKVSKVMGLPHGTGGRLESAKHIVNEKIE